MILWRRAQLRFERGLTAAPAASLTSGVFYIVSSKRNSSLRLLQSRGLSASVGGRCWGLGTGPAGCWCRCSSTSAGQYFPVPAQRWQQPIPRAQLLGIHVAKCFLHVLAAFLKCTSFHGLLHFFPPVNEPEQTLKWLHQLETHTSAHDGRVHQWKENIPLESFFGCHRQGRICILGLIWKVAFWFSASRSGKDRWHLHFFCDVSGICVGRWKPVLPLFPQECQNMSHLAL